MIKTVYAYLFFFLYNSINKPKDNIFVQWKAVFVILILELVLISSFIIYWINIFKIKVPAGSHMTFQLSIAIPLVLIKLWFFEVGEKWKTYLEKFNKWSLEKQKKWNIGMRCLIFAVFANLLLAFYWMSQIDWSQYN